MPEEESEDELQERLRRLIGDEPSSRAELPDIDEEMDARLDALRQKAQQTRGAYESKKAEENRRLEQDSEAHRGTGVGLSIGYTIIGLPLVGALVGYLVDNAMKTHYWVGLLTLLGAAVGIVMAVVMLNRLNK